MNQRTKVFVLLCCVAQTASVAADESRLLQAGAARIDITERDASPPGRIEAPLHARALVLKRGETMAVLVTLDVVAIGEIGAIKNDFLPKLRTALRDLPGFRPEHLIVNASHCHGIPCKDVLQRTIQVVREAADELQPVTVGSGMGFEDRIQENRRLKLKDGREIDVRHAYSMPPDDQVAAVGPIDPEIGILKLNRTDGSTLAVVYNFACHPIQGAANGANTADLSGIASQVIEDNLGSDAVALFVQGCGGDINPALYKEMNLPRDAEPLGNRLGLSTLKAIRRIECEPTEHLNVTNRTLELPRADLAERIDAMQREQDRLVNSLGGTTLNLKSFLPLLMKYRLDEDFPAYYSHSYLNEEQQGRRTLQKLDDDNRRALESYIRNIQTMEQLTRVRTNLKLLQKHQQRAIAAERKPIRTEVAGLRVGEFRLVTFPGELTVQIGLNLKAASPFEHTFISGYTNGYIYYSPTAQQLENVGNAQEDSDCLLAPEWQALFESTALQVIEQL
ncbi:MAG: hypothetical protein Fues2KO_15810 [Fuerstiella sp.]